MCFWGHTWSQWKEVTRPMRWFYKGQVQDGTQAFQERTCTVCGKLQSEAI